MNDNDYKIITDQLRQAYEPSATDKQRIYQAVIGSPALPISTAVHSAGIPVSIKSISAIVVIALGIGAILYLSRPQSDATNANNSFQNNVSTPEVKNSEQHPTPVSPAAPASHTIETSLPPIPADTASIDALTGSIPQQADTAPPPRKTVHTSAKRHAKSEAEPNIPSTPPKIGLGDELKLISGASAAINAGAPYKAMSLLNQHRSKFPNGVMAQERDGLEIISLCHAGNLQRAKQKFVRFQKKSPNAPILIRINNTCAFNE